MLPALVATFLGGGCASPGEPTPRRVIVPQAVQDLQARQQGDEVVLSFTLPGQSTRGEPLAAPPAIEIYRGDVAAGGQPVARISTRLVYTIPSEMADSYLSRVEGQSVLVVWPGEAGAAYRVYKAEVAPESAAAAAVDPARATVWRPLVQVAQLDASENGAGGASNVLQYQDEDVEFSHSYMYFVRRVARFDADTVESADSNAAVITVAVAAPPAAPDDVDVVIVPAGAESAYVTLSWAIAPAADVTGYAVYRSEQPGMQGARLNEQTVGSPTYRDDAVFPGRRYFYSVTAVDASGRESAPSEALEAQIPATQP